MDFLDVGSYRPGDAWTWVNISCAAREMGDVEAVEAIDAGIAERFVFDHSRRGARKLAGVSTWANTVFALAQFIRPGSMRALGNGEVPDAWRTGPTVVNAAHPDVLVAEAVTDGEGLELVLRPGGAGTVTTLELGRLRPGGAYR